MVLPSPSCSHHRHMNILPNTCMIKKDACKTHPNLYQMEEIGKDFASDAHCDFGYTNSNSCSAANPISQIHTSCTGIILLPFPIRISLKVLTQRMFWAWKSLIFWYGNVFSSILLLFFFPAVTIDLIPSKLTDCSFWLKTAF